MIVLACVVIDARGAAGAGSAAGAADGAVEQAARSGSRSSERIVITSSTWVEVRRRSAGAQPRMENPGPTHGPRNPTFQSRGAPSDPWAGTPWLKGKSP